MADQFEKNPLLAIDYLKRAYLISGEDTYREEAYKLFEKASIKGRAKNSVEMILADFCIPLKPQEKEEMGRISPPAMMESTSLEPFPFVK